MSWSDIFYPDNPKRRAECIAELQKLKDLLEGNFNATNKLIDVLNNHLHDTHIDEAKLDMDETIRKNCNVLKDKLNEIHLILEEKYTKIKDVLDPDILKILDDPDLTIDAKFKMGSKITDTAVGIIGTVAGVITVNCIKAGTILVRMVEVIGVIGSCAIAMAGIAVLALGIDMIFSAIYGAVERKLLEDTLDELHTQLHTYQPASEKFLDSIYLIRAYVQLSDRDNE